MYCFALHRTDSIKDWGFERWFELSAGWYLSGLCFFKESQLPVWGFQPGPPLLWDPEFLFFLSPQPHRFLETAQLFRYCLGIDKSQGKKWLRLLSQIMHFFWDLGSLVCNALVIFRWLEVDWKKKMCLVHIFQHFLQEGSLWWVSLPLSPGKMPWRQDLGVGPHLPRFGVEATSWQLEEWGEGANVEFKGNVKPSLLSSSLLYLPHYYWSSPLD